MKRIKGGQNKEAKSNIVKLIDRCRQDWEDDIADSKYGKIYGAYKFIEAVYDSITSTIRSIGIGIYNVFHYLLMVWQDRPYSEHFLFYFMIVKMKMMELFFAGNYRFSDVCCVQPASVLKSIRICRKLLERISDTTVGEESDYYMRTYYLQWQKKWGRDKDFENGRLVTDMTDEESEDFRIMHAKERAKREKDFALFVKILTMYHELWWD